MSEQSRLISRAEAALYCGITPSAFSEWVRKGRLPSPLPGTTRWDKKAIDAKLDRLSGLQSSENLQEQEFDEVEARIDARLAQRRTQGKKASGRR